MLNTHCNIVWPELPINTQTTFKGGEKTCKFTNISEMWIICKVFSDVWNSLFPSSSHILKPLTWISETPNASGHAKYRHIYIVDTVNRIPAAKTRKTTLSTARHPRKQFISWCCLMWQKLDVMSCTRGQRRKGGVLILHLNYYTLLNIN